MKRISIFGKEFYIFTEKEHKDALNYFCGVEVGVNGQLNQDWIERHVLKEGHVIDNMDLMAIHNMCLDRSFARKNLEPLKKSIGWD